jgi:hypothetical protein
MLLHETTMSPAEIKFHHHYKSREGLLFHQFVPYGEMLNASLEQFKTRIENYQSAISGFPDINYNFIAKSSINAVSSKSLEMNEYYIGIHIELSIFLMICFCG